MFVCRNLHLATLAVLAINVTLHAEDVVQVELRPDVLRNIGGIIRFDRDQFVTVHEGPGSGDLTQADHRVLRDELDVRYGRNGGLLSWQASRVPAAANDPDMPDVTRLRKLASKPPADNKARDSDMREVVLCAHPELLHAMPDNDHAAWGPRTYESIAEFTAQFIKAHFQDDARPRYLEVFNEPFVKARKIGTTIDALSEQHNVVAKRVRQLCPNVLIGGYSAAYVELEIHNFGHWDSRQKRFMDIAGEEMDFFSYHIYDGVNVTGTPRVRTGSNAEAIMDLINTYSHMKFGVAKPILITEYGNIPAASMSPAPYDAQRTASMLYSLVGQLMTFMDHPDVLAKVIPYILGKAEWTYTADTKPGEANVFLLWRRDAEGAYVETDLFLFYRFLLGLGGEWRYSRSSNPDVRVHLLADGKRLALMLMNLDHAAKRVVLSGLENLDVTSCTGRFLYTDGKEPVLGIQALPTLPRKLKLRGGTAIMVIANLKDAIDANRVIQERRFYATECTKDIKANRPTRFQFSNIPTGNGEVIVRLSTGRPPGLSKLPTRVELNGQSLQIPDNWAGGEQEGRKNFFGTIELSASANLLEPESRVDVVYSDGGGKVASVVLQTNLEK
ncbi:MAG: beta-agarase [Planctomycetota bacterium]